MGQTKRWGLCTSVQGCGVLTRNDYPVSGTSSLFNQFLQRCVNGDATTKQWRCQVAGHTVRDGRGIVSRGDRILLECAGVVVTVSTLSVRYSFGITRTQRTLKPLL